MLYIASDKVLISLVGERLSDSEEKTIDYREGRGLEKPSRGAHKEGYRGKGRSQAYNFPGCSSRQRA